MNLTRRGLFALLPLLLLCGCAHRPPKAKAAASLMVNGKELMTCEFPSGEGECSAQGPAVTIHSGSVVTIKVVTQAAVSQSMATVNAK